MYLTKQQFAQAGRPTGKSSRRSLIPSAAIFAPALILPRASVLIQKFESLQIRVAAPESCWTGKGISDGTSDGGTGSQRDRASGVEAAFVAAEDRAGVGAPRPHCS